MKILFLADIVPYPPNTGIKIRTFNIIRELSRCGDEIFLICFNHPIFINDEQTKERFRNELMKLCREVHILEIPGEGSELKTRLRMFRNLFQKHPFRVRRYYSTACRDLIETISAKHQLDIIHLDKTEFYIYAERHLPRLVAIPTNHNVESQLFRRRAAHESSLLRRAFSYLQFIKTQQYEKYALTKVPLFIACTDLDRNYFKTVLGIDTPSATIDNGVDTRYYKPLAGNPGDYILLIGAQNKDAAANYDATMFFIDSIWPRIKMADSSVGLKIVGRNPDPSILALPQQDERIEVVGFVQDEREYLGRARALVVPLRVGGGSRLKIFTAMAMGTPVVSTTIGAEGIAYTHGRDILIADDAEDFARETSTVIHDDSLYDEISHGARRLAESRYDWTIIGKRLHDLYLEQIR